MHGVQALEFGVAAHHSGLSVKYRRAAEVLFRAAQVCVLFATGTLAQGLNMPARTVALDGDSEFLNPLTYHQMAGRAGMFTCMCMMYSFVFWVFVRMRGSTIFSLDNTCTCPRDVLHTSQVSAFGSTR